VHRRGGPVSRGSRVRHEDQCEPRPACPLPAGDPLEPRGSAKAGPSCPSPVRGLPDQGHGPRSEAETAKPAGLASAPRSRGPDPAPGTSPGGQAPPAQQSRWHPRHRPRPKEQPALLVKHPITLPATGFTISGRACCVEARAPGRIPIQCCGRTFCGTLCVTCHSWADGAADPEYGHRSQRTIVGKWTDREADVPRPPRLTPSLMRTPALIRWAVSPAVYGEAVACRSPV